MSIHNTKEEVIQQKKKSIRMLNDLLENLINDDNTIRKADLISKWIKDYVNYIKFEDVFDPTRNIAYHRGDIIKANFGFNLGSELGGVHYAVVIDNKNFHSSDTITVIPLCSAKENKHVYKRDLFIGSEFYNTASSKYTSALSRTKDNLQSTMQLKNEVSEIVRIYGDNVNDDSIKNLMNRLTSQIDSINKELLYLDKFHNEIELMNDGSIVKIEQIRTISKLRIWIPKKSTDPLYGIRLSPNTMDKINIKLKELFIFTNNS